MVRLVTYADEKMSRALELCMQSSLKYGVNDARGYNKGWWHQWKDVDTFEWLNKETLNQERGCGYWLWKPWAIAHSMFNLCKEDDVLVYADAGVEFVASVYEIINRMDEDIFFFTNGFPNVEWCKGDILKGILGYEYKPADTNAREFKQVQASVIFFKVNQKTRDFVKEWLLYCQMPGWIDDSPSKTPNYPTFAENRHDQAVLSCLQQKHGYKLHWWPTQYSEHIRIPGDTYPVIFNHHRKRNDEW